MELPKIIGIAGTNGSGKDTLADQRLLSRGAVKVSGSDMLRKEASARGLSHERVNLRAIGDEWAQRFGAGAISIAILNDYYDSFGRDASTGLSIVSIRRPDEARVIQDAGGAMLWIDAERDIRYERIMAGSRDRIDDRKTFEQFSAEESIEMDPGSDDPFTINMSAVREIADIHIDNTFTGSNPIEGPRAFKQYLAERFAI